MVPLRLGIDVWLPDLAAGLTLAIAGAVITSVDPGSRLGLIVEVAALAWFLPNFTARAFGPWRSWRPARSCCTAPSCSTRSSLSQRPYRAPERTHLVVLAYASVLGLLALGEVQAIVWSVAALMAFVAIVITRTGPARDAGVRAFPTMVLVGARHRGRPTCCCCWSATRRHLGRSCTPTKRGSRPLAWS